MLPGGSSHDRRKFARAVKRAVSKVVSLPMVPPASTEQASPWYESTLFWSCISIAAAIVLTVIAAVMRNLRWLLVFLWPVLLPAALVVIRKVRIVFVRVVVVVLLLGVPVGLWILNGWLMRVSSAPTTPTPEAIKELDAFIVGRDEAALRQAFGFEEMFDTNVRMNIEVARHFRGSGKEPLSTGRYTAGKQMIVDTEIAKGHLQRYGGNGFLDCFANYDGTICLLVLPAAYSSGKEKLLKFETSSELPSPVIDGVKNFDNVVSKNASSLLHFLNDAMKKNPDYYLRYDDDSSPEFFHTLHHLWLQNFVDLRPEADKITQAIRHYLNLQ